MIDEVHQDQAGLYVMRALPAAEALAFAREVEADPELREYVAGLEAAAAQLAHAAPQRLLPPELKARVLSAVAGTEESSALPWGSWLPWAVAVCAVGAAGALWQANQGLQTRLALETSARVRGAQVQAQYASVRRRDPLGAARITSLSTDSPPYDKAAATVIFDDKEQRGIVKLENFPPPAAGKDYQLWVIEPGGAAPVSVGVVHVSRDGGTRSSFKPARAVSGVDTFAISIEPTGGSPAPTGEIVFVGK